MIEIGPALVAYSRVAPGRRATIGETPWLSGPERERARRWGPGPRADGFVEGRRLLRELTLRLAPGVDPAVEARCGRCGRTDHGPVRATHAPVVLSLSYSEPFVVAAGATLDCTAALGIDLERGDPDTVLQELAPLFSPADPPTLRRWTAIEAATKADGRGLRLPPDRICIAGDRAQLPGSDASFRLLDAGAPEGFTATLALIDAG
ncbi:hypothetical protein GCM10010910_19800 [Microbacterium nanhaiense]|uniref:4'-phosphopantetheinyl transferase n=1 Tax=Microbacterium nanhaiense TaxID=1301026 RepID=A0ABQ2N3M2_9MICO|nr:hypothetical protein [Microbacterium nanhaiense]GGO64581.1 hypothetical protein GCM10010910_19800 [Microbacterium nanhaiense]